VAESKKEPRPAPLTGAFPVDRQRALAPWLAGALGFDLARGGFGEVAHPYTMTVNRDDVRVTTRYDERAPLNAIYSTIHECGHGIYEQNMDPALDAYGLGEGASMSVHESQSRLYENFIGRSRAFCGLLLPKLQELFPQQMEGWDRDALYRAANAVAPSPIRILADELTYCLHIMVRYELEKGLIEGALSVDGLPAAWNAAYERYLGVTPRDDAEGVLQDVHWSGGTAGYFPSYALGTAYAAQIHRAMRRELDVDALVSRGDLAPMGAWLRARLHRYGQSLTPEQALQAATGEAFDPVCFAGYLEGKYTELY
jgi:carboxypeptidase Taq